MKGMVSPLAGCKVVSQVEEMESQPMTRGYVLGAIYLAFLVSVSILLSDVAERVA